MPTYIDPNIMKPYRFLNSIIVSTTDSSALFLSCSPLHFLNFCRDYLKDKCIRIPYLVVDKIWIDNKEEINQSLVMKINEMVSLDKIQEVSNELGLTYNNDNIKSVSE